MNESTPKVSYEAIACNDGTTNHALLVTAYEKAQQIGFFDTIDRHLHVAMRTKQYSPLDKVKTLVASILIGCDHTKQINTELGAHESELAALFGLSTGRFPDQSGINRLLHRLTAASVDALRLAAFDLTLAHWRARTRALWLRLPGGRRVLVVDIDQRALVVRGKTFEFAEPGFFGRKRGRRGYQLSLMYLGGQVREVLDEFFDPGATYAGVRMHEMLERLGRLCDALEITRQDVLIRCDAQYGTPAIIAEIISAGFEYLIKGISPARAKKLMKVFGAEVRLEVARGSEPSEVRRVADAGWLEHTGKAVEGKVPRIRARTILGVWEHEVAAKGGRPGPTSRAKRRREGRERERVATMEYWLTSLEAEDLPAVVAVELYNARQTIEAYFKDEQQALGARHVRTKVWAGAAAFQWLVALSNNLLRWLQQEAWAGTVLEHLGLTRLVKEAMAIGGRIRRARQTVVVTLERRHPLVRCLLANWKPLMGPLHRRPTDAAAGSTTWMPPRLHVMGP